jgi:hypothetical protein
MRIKNVSASFVVVGFRLSRGEKLHDEAALQAPEEMEGLDSPHCGSIALDR